MDVVHSGASPPRLVRAFFGICLRDGVVAGAAALTNFCLKSADVRHSDGASAFFLGFLLGLLFDG